MSYQVVCNSIKHPGKVVWRGSRRSEAEAQFVLTVEKVKRVGGRGGRQLVQLMTLMKDYPTAPREKAWHIEQTWDSEGRASHGHADARRGRGGVSTTAWRNTPAGIAKYNERRAEAQRRANETGFDHGLEANDVFKDYMVSMLPAKQHRTGHELRVEVVHPEDLSRAQRGHGPNADYGDAVQPRVLTRDEIDLLRRMQGFEYPRGVLAGKDVRTIDRLVGLGVLAERTKRNGTRVYTVTRAGREAANPFGIGMSGGGHGPRHADAHHVTYETRAVLGGAYRGRDISERNLLTHTLMIVDGKEERVLCTKRLAVDHLADPYSTDTNEAPTCPVCRARDPRFSAPSHRS